MVIDDDECVRNLAVTMLSRLGYPAVAASSGREAMERLEQSVAPPQVALMDMDMPDMSGAELLPRLVELCPDMKVVVCSGYTLAGPVQDLLDRGAHAFLQKPFTFNDLAALVRSLIERRRFARYEVEDGLAVFFWESEPHREKLIDLSLGGASVPALGTCDDPDLWRELSIEAGNGGFRITGIPFQFIAPTPVARPRSGKRDPVRRQSMRFGELSADQSLRVGEFITRCAR
ncbi:response regulator [Desulfatiferula olefinivorans]